MTHLVEVRELVKVFPGRSGHGRARLAVGSQQGRKVFTLQSLPASDPQETLAETVGKVAGFSLHAGVAARADERQKLERLCRYISRAAGGTVARGATMATQM